MSGWTVSILSPETATLFDVHGRLTDVAQATENGLSLNGHLLPWKDVDNMRAAAYQKPGVMARIRRETGICNTSEAVDTGLETMDVFDDGSRQVL